MAIKPLKISWRDWCLYKLGTRDYSAYEMRQAIEKRAAAAGETVDAGPIVEGLVADGAIDDERYVRNQLSLHSGTFTAKGPRHLRRLLRTRGGIDEALIASAIDDSDHRWFKAAESQCRKILGQDAPADGSRRPLPEKQYFGLKQKLYGRGFTAEQIEHALAGYTPQREAPSVDPAVDVAKWVERRMADGKGPADIERFLAQKGVEKTVIYAHLDFPAEVWIDIAGRERERRFGPPMPKTAKEKRRQSDFLLRRGFSYDHIKAVISAK